MVCGPYFPLKTVCLLAYGEKKCSKFEFLLQNYIAPPLKQFTGELWCKNKLKTLIRRGDDRSVTYSYQHDWLVAPVSLSNRHQWIICGICGKTKRRLINARQTSAALRPDEVEQDMIYDRAGQFGTAGTWLFHTLRGKSQNFTVPGSLHRRGILWLRQNMAVLHGLLGASSNQGY